MYSQMFRNLLAYHDIFTIYDKLRRRYGDVEIVWIEIPRQSIAGHIYRDKEYVGKNLLLNNFWAYLLGFLSNTTTTFYDEGGFSRNLCYNTDPTGGVAVVCVGNSSLPETFTQYRLQGSYSCYSASFTIGYDTVQGNSIITVSASSQISGAETGIRQLIGCGSGYFYNAFLNRKVISISAGQIVTHRIIFSMPWVLNTATLFWGLLRDANVSITDITGYSFTARTSGVVNASAQKLVISESPITFSPTLITIPNMISVTTYNFLLYGYASVSLVVLGVYTPDVSRTIQTIALLQDIYDTTGTARTVLTLTYPLSTAITLSAGKPYMFMIRIVGF